MSPTSPRHRTAPTLNTDTCAPVFQWPVRIYWEDTDAGGIVFYANYLKFFERARTEWLRHHGFEQQRLREEQGGMFVVTDAQLSYHHPARLDDLLLVTARVTEAKRASLTIAQSAVLQLPTGRTDTLLCEGSVRIGWVESGTLHPRRIPDAVLGALTSGNP